MCTVPEDDIIVSLPAETDSPGSTIEIPLATSTDRGATPELRTFNESGTENVDNRLQRFRFPFLLHTAEGRALLRPEVSYAFLLLAICVQITAFILPHWRQNGDMHWGMFEICENGNCQLLQPDDLWRGAQRCYFSGILIMVMTITLNEAFTHETYSCLIVGKPLAFVLSGIPLAMISTTGWGFYPDKPTFLEGGTASWSFYLVLMSMYLIFVPCFFLFFCGDGWQCTDTVPDEAH